MFGRKWVSQKSSPQKQEKRYLDLVARLEAAAVAAHGLPASARRAELLSKLEGTDPLAAIEIVRQLHQTLPLGGDVCEFGVAQGRTSALIADEIRVCGANASLRLYDSFQGLPKPSERDELIDDIFCLGTIEAYVGQMRVPQSEVVRRMDEIKFKSFAVVPGFISETTPIPARVCFAYLDMDFFEPTLLGLRLLWPSLADGGAVMVDDYGFFSTGIQHAVAEFVSGRKDVQLHQSTPGAGPFVTLIKVGQ